MMKKERDDGDEGEKDDADEEEEKRRGGADQEGINTRVRHLKTRNRFQGYIHVLLVGCLLTPLNMNHLKECESRDGQTSKEAQKR